MKNLNNLEFANYLKSKRKEKCFKQVEVSDLLKIKQGTYSNYELGYSEPPKEILKKLSELFEVDLLEIRKVLDPDDAIPQEIKFFRTGCKYPIEQFLFFDEFNEIRKFIDSIDDKQKRALMALEFSRCLSEFLESNLKDD